MLEAQIKSLLAAVTAESGQHLAEVEADLEQTRRLLAEAVEKLGSAFVAVHQDIAAQQELIAGQMANDCASAASLAVVRERIATHVGAAVTGLQFQDLVNQIVERAQHRLEGVRDALTTLGVGADCLDDDPHTRSRALGRLNRALADSSQALHRRLRKKVDQRGLDCGDIELF